MSAQTMADAWAPVQALYHEQVARATWGHLAPRKNKAYRGYVVFALGCYDSGELNPTPLACEFAGLDDSPWFYEAINDFIQTFGGEPGDIYRWEGSFRNYAFKGVLKKMRLCEA